MNKAGSSVIRWTFDDYELDATLFRLLRRGEPVALQRKPLYLLKYLVQNADRVVPSNELVREVWPDVAVTDASLRRAIKVLRRTLGEGYIESSRGFGYRLAAPVRTHAGPPVEELAASGGDVFVGREEELHALEEELERALSGASRFVLVVGAPGMGKTRLLREFWDRADARGAAVALGQCWEGGESPAFWPWGSMLRDLAIDDAQTDLSDLLQPEAAPSRFRMFVDLSNSLRTHAQHQPLVLFIEDGHWAEEPALLLAKFVTEQLADSRLLIVCTCRAAELVADTSRSNLLTTLGDRGKVVTLQPLEQADVATLLRRSSSLVVDDQMAGEVARSTGGNPLFVRGLIPVLEARQGKINDREASPSWTPPSSIRDAIRAQMRPLNERTRNLLSTAAALGEDFAAQLLCEVTGTDAGELVDALASAVLLRILEPVGPGRFRFAHALFRDALYDELGGAERLQIHLKIARAHERLVTAGSDEHAATLAYHYTRAVPLEGALERAIECTLRAGRWSLKTLAYEQARDQFTRALDLGTQAPAASARSAETLIGLGDAQRLCGQGESAKRTFLRLAELARAGDDPEPLAEAALGYGRAHYESGLTDQSLLGLLGEALERLPRGDSSQRVALLCRLSIALQFARCPERRRALSDEAMAIAQRLTDPHAIAGASLTRVHEIWSTADPEHRRQFATAAAEAVLAQEKTGDLERLAHALLFRCIAMVETGDGPKLREEFARFTKLTEQLQHPALNYFVTLTQGMSALLEGRFETGHELSRKALSQGQQLKIAVAQILFASQEYALRRDRGGLETWLADYEEFSPTIGRDFGIDAAIRAFISYECGEPELGRQDLDQLLATGLRDQLTKHNWLVVLTIAGDAAAGLEHRPAAQELYEILLPFRESVVASGSVAAVHGIVAYSLGGLTRVLQRQEESVHHLELALHLANKLAAAPWKARCQLALAETFVALKHRERAVSYLADARRLGEALAMPYLLRRVAHVEKLL